MKKIMIALAAVALAAVSQAATINWGSGTVYNSANTKANATTQVVSMYVWEISQTAYDTYAALSATDLSKAIYADFGASLATADATGTTNAKGQVTKAGATDHTTFPVYGAILFLDANNADMAMGNIAKVTWEGVGVPGASGLATNLNAGASAPVWAETVPEPTSGLLLLLGMAGLALKRKIA